MNSDIIKGKWQEIKGKLKTQWANLTDDDILKAEGSYDKLCGRIQERYGHNKDRVEKEISEFIKKNKWK